MQPESSSPQSSNYSETNKSTRKYVKTGKYSKKKQQQQQQQIQAAIQQQIQATLQQRQQPLTPQQILALQQSLQDAAMNGMTASGTRSPVNPSNQPIAPSATLTVPDAQLPYAPPQPPSSMTDPSPNDPLKQLLSLEGGYKTSRELEDHAAQVKKRCIESLVKDHDKVTRPDYLTPFRSMEDALERLLPYHIYQYPAADLDANKVPLERQDQTMLDIYKARKDVFEKHGQLVKRSLKENNKLVHQIMLERCVLMDIRQKINEEQARVNEEQRAQQQALRTQAEIEKTRLLQEQQYQQQYHQYQQQQQQYQQGQPLDVKYAQTLHALMQNKEFAEQYQKLTPELQQQFLRNLNHDKVAEFLKRKV
ncbi:hypothetical protein BC941DRAFT_474208 [Chlamydoabsidia padenii]|nr:hypothetical protein BC941DRAFT_474208 [Chlamydoabsidia padenii]